MTATNRVLPVADHTFLEGDTGCPNRRNRHLQNEIVPRVVAISIQRFGSHWLEEFPYLKSRVIVQSSEASAFP